MISAVNPSAFRLTLLRRFNTWYTVKDGNWSDPAIWTGNGKKRHTVPQPGDSVFINNRVTLDVNLVTVYNLYGNGYLILNGGQITVNGDIQITGTVDNSGVSNLNLNGYNNSITNFIAGTSTVQYLATYTQTILSLSYSSLVVANGPKFLVADLSITGGLTVGNNNPVTLDTKGFNISVAGNSSMAQLATIISNSTILFTGIVSTGATSTITGTASIELRNGNTGQVSNWPTCNVNFTTNNQLVNANLNCNNLTITGAITVTNPAAVPVNAAGTINGTVAGSTFTNNGIVIQNGTTVPMTTGIFNYNNASTSVIEYVVNGNYTLPYTTYSGLQISGTGVKTVSGNTTATSLTLNNNGALELSTFNLTVTGSSSIGGILSKSGAGSILMIGMLFLRPGSVGSSFSGNPSWEFRGGIGLSTNWPTAGMGSGTFSFTTNSQSIDMSAGSIISNNMLVGSGVTLTYLAGSSAAFTGVLNGVDATSIFDNRGSFTYRNATAPMVTGKLYCNQASNLWVYNLAGNQNITVPADPVSPGYQNLTLNNSGAKKLLGNVSVKGTYTLTSPATLDASGFALTNP